MKIGWIGLGNMGAPMAKNAANAGFTVIAFNRTPKALDIGNGTLAKTIEETVSDVDVVAVMVSDGAAVEAVLFGEDGVMAYAKPGTLVINFSTIGVDETMDIALQVVNAGLEWMDAPVSGSVGPAINGQLVILAGGSEGSYQRVKPFFDSMAKSSFYLGVLGSGAGMKLLVNAYLGAVVETATECLAMSDKAGFGRGKLLDVLRETAVWSPVLGAKEDMWNDRTYPQAFAMKHMAKDLGLMMSYARTMSASMPTLGSVLQMYLSALANDMAELDMAGILEEAIHHTGTNE